jgi:hypothetical protein
MIHKGENYSIKLQKYYFCNGTILAIIRELEIVNEWIYPEHKNVSKMIPQIIRNFFIHIILKFQKETLIYFNKNEVLTIDLLEIINPIFTSLKYRKIKAYNYYFIDCFHYKINDHLTAIDYFKKYKSSNSDHDITISACEFINNILDNNIRPSIWKCWW